MKWGCRGHWGCWGCCGHWGHLGSWCQGNHLICKNAKSFLGKNSLNVSNVKLFSKKINVFGFFMPFWWVWQEPKWPQWPQQPQQPQWPQWPLQPHFIKKNLWFKEKIFFRWSVTFYYLKKAPKSQNNSKFMKEQEVLSNWTIDGAHHQKNKNWWIEYKWPYLINM
jgi:hypothetical protein